MKFETWLITQSHRDDPVGDLANDYIKARNFSRNPYAERIFCNDKNNFEIEKQMAAWNASLSAYRSLFQALEEFDGKPYHEDAPSDLFYYENMNKFFKAP